MCQLNIITGGRIWNFRLSRKGWHMKKETVIHRIFIKLLKKIGIIKEIEIDKAEMCKRAIDSGVCPKACDTCAWNTSPK